MYLGQQSAGSSGICMGAWSGASAHNPMVATHAAPIAFSAGPVRRRSDACTALALLHAQPQPQPAPIWGQVEMGGNGDGGIGACTQRRIPHSMIQIRSGQVRCQPLPIHQWSPPARFTRSLGLRSGRSLFFLCF